MILIIFFKHNLSWWKRSLPSKEGLLLCITSFILIKHYQAQQILGIMTLILKLITTRQSVPLTPLHHSGISAAGRLWCLHRSHGRIFIFLYIFVILLLWEKTKHCFGFCIYLTVGGTLLMIIVMIAILKTTIVIVNFNWHQLFDLLQLFLVAWIPYRIQI